MKFRKLLLAIAAFDTERKRLNLTNDDRIATVDRFAETIFRFSIPERRRHALRRDSGNVPGLRMAVKYVLTDV